MMAVAVRNQHDIGICYASAAAQMIDVWRFSHVDFLQQFHALGRSTRFNSSDVVLAVSAAAVRETEFVRDCQIVARASRQNDSLPFEGGNICEIVNRAKSAGSCSDEVINKKLKELKNSSNERLSTVLQRIEDFSQVSKLCGELMELNKKLSAEKCPEEQFHRKMLAAFGPIASASSIALNNLDHKLAEFCSDTNQSPAETFKTSPLPTCEPIEFDGLSTEHRKNKIDDLLKTGQPIGLSFNTCFLVDSCGQHAALIIGSRRDPSDPARCQYLLRNSWGTSCEEYKDKWKRGCEERNGSVWINSKDLLENSDGISYLH
jgi:hypothetical protein